MTWWACQNVFHFGHWQGLAVAIDAAIILPLLPSSDASFGRRKRPVRLGKCIMRLPEPTDLDGQVEQKASKASIVVNATLVAVLWILDWTIDLILYLRQNKLAIEPTKRVGFNEQLKRDLFRRQDRRCMYCGVRRILRNFEIDHIHPVARGGSNDRSNLQLLCSACNARKGVHTDKEFRLRYSTLLPPLAEGRRPAPPQSPIPQKEFSRITRETQAATGVRIYRANKYLTPKQRIASGAPVAGGIVGVIWFFAVGTLSGELGLIGGIVIGVSIWAGLYLRARYTGKLDQ